jgi:hypothetical protein
MMQQCARTRITSDIEVRWARYFDVYGIDGLHAMEWTPVGQVYRLKTGERQTADCANKLAPLAPAPPALIDDTASLFALDACSPCFV